ncbi:Dor1-domain-containing protein [Wolfiporia cocos MD-104 SS10]|uniref:Conserved oligomeric Golgi complex subunit 8 n=1 Tax=Wolfiporia cocos (strain MD-104) TaxID=742152 RepID=A0A2H3IW01_WOLCO|nr:Dor1-domain-containing protein [Wolfiporia cocos MD-104 SS10]
MSAGLDPPMSTSSTDIPDDPDLGEIPTLPELLAASATNALPSSTFSSPESLEYLTQLTSLPLSKLEAQPTELSSSFAQLTNALTTLCYTSYPTFLSIHSTTSTLSSSLSSLSSSLEALISSLPTLEASARSFGEDTREIQKERRKASLVLEHHDKLYDVLSLPTLLDSCIRNHNYTEALLLANHSTSLSQRFPDNPLIQSVKSDCDARVQAMLGQLLRMLSEQAKLPALFRAVGFLRKMDVLDEPELALAFLTGRRVYLEGLLRTVEPARGDREAHARFLKRYVDLWREGVYDAVTQYTTIFLERAASPSAPGPAPPTQLHALLTAFTTLQVQTLLALLRDTLPAITDPSLLTSLLTQLTYCANSFARVGMDFRGLLAPIFVDVVREGLRTEFQEAMEGWCAKLASATASKPKATSSAAGKRPAHSLIAPLALSSPPLPTAAQLKAVTSGPPNVPPPSLVSYPPLAAYTNAILTALNGLRMLAPVELLDDLLRMLDESLARSAQALLAFARDVASQSLGSAEEEAKDRAVVKATGVVYVRVFAPFIRRALVEGVYGVDMSEAEVPEGSELAGALQEWRDYLDELGAGTSQG